MTRGQAFPDHTLSPWEVTGDAGLAVVVRDTILAVWELGLFEGDEGFEEMAGFASCLCEAHNAVLASSGMAAETPAAARARGSAGDRSAERWGSGTILIGGTERSGVDAARGLVALLDVPGMPPVPAAERVREVAARMVRLHNGLLTSDTRGKGN